MAKYTNEFGDVYDEDEINQFAQDQNTTFDDIIERNNLGIAEEVVNEEEPLPKPKKKPIVKTATPAKTQKQKVADVLQKPIETDFSSLGGPSNRMSTKEAMKTPEQKAKEVKVIAETKKRTELDQAKMEARYAKVAARPANKEYLAKTQPTQEYVSDLDKDIANKIKADGTYEEYMDYGKNDFDAPKTRSVRINSFEKEKKEVVQELLKSGKLLNYTPKEILDLAAKKYKKNEESKYINDQTISFYNNTSEETKDLLEDYAKKERNFQNLDLEKKTTVNKEIYKHLEDSAEEVIELEAKLKAYGDKPVFKTQEEADNYKTIYDDYQFARKSANQLLNTFSYNNTAINQTQEKLKSAEEEYDLAKRNYGFLTGAGTRGFGALADMGGSIIQLVNYANPITNLLGIDDDIAEYVALSTRKGQEARNAYLGEQESITDLKTFGKASFNIIAEQIPNLLLMYATGGGSTALKGVAEVGAKQIGEKALLEGTKLTGKQLAEKAAADIGLGAFKTVAQNNQYARLMEAGLSKLSLSPELQAISAVSAGSKYSEQVASNALNETNFTPLQMLSSSLLYGYAEGLSEKVTLDILKGGGRTLEALVKNDKAFVDMLKDQSLKSWFTNGTKFVGEKFVDFAEENVTEQFANVAQNSIDKFILGKNVNLLDNTGEVFKDTSILSGWMISAPHVAGLAIKPFLAKDQTKEIKQNSAEIARYVQLLKNPKISAAEKSVFKSKIKELSDKSEQVFKNTIKDIDGMPNSTFKAILSKSNELGSILQKAKDIYNSDSADKMDAIKILEGQYKQKETELNSVVDRTKIISQLKGEFSKEDKAKLFNLTNQAEDLKNELKSLKNDPGSDVILIEKNNQLKDINEKINNAYATAISEAKRVKAEASLEKNIITDIEKTKAASKALGLGEEIDMPDLNTANDVITYLSNNTELDENTIEDIADSYGAFIPLANGKEALIINKEAANMDQVVTTGQHEFLHKLIYKAVKDKPELQKKIGTDLYNHIEDYIGTETFNNTEFKNRYDIYKSDFENTKLGLENKVAKAKDYFDKGIISQERYNQAVSDAEVAIFKAEGKYLEETLPLLSESLTKGDIKYNETFFTKIGDILRKIFQKYGLSKVKFDTGKDVFNFVRDYNKSFEKGQFTKAFKELAKEGTYKGSVAKGNVPIRTTTKTTVKKSQPLSQVETLKKQLKDIQDNEFDYDPDDFDQQVANLQNKIKKAVEKEKTSPVVEVKKEVSEEDADKEIIKNERSSLSSDKVQKIYDEKGLSGAQDIIDLFKPITKKLVNRRMDAPGFDRELLTDEIETGTGGILDLISKYKPDSGIPLAAFINKYLPVRAIAASRRVLDKDFSKDVTEEKGLIAEETVSETKEKPKYKNALESKIFEPEALEIAKNKIITVVRTLKSKIDEPISLNRTVTPLIAEIRDEIGKQLDIDLKTAMGGKKDDQLKNWLLKNKRYVLENMTTTWLMGKDGQGGIPQAIQKQVDGRWINYPEWVGKKIDRETTSTDLAGRTSGAELARRLPNVANNVSEADYLSQILEPSGNPIRGRKESLAKAIAEESAFDIINKDFEEEGPIFDAFKANQERLGVYLKDNVTNEFAKQAERGNVKFSKKLIKGFEISQDKLGKDIYNAETIEDEINVINNWIASDGRSLRTLAWEIGKGLKQFTTNKGLFENIILPIIKTYSKFEGIIGKDSYRLGNVDKGQSIYFGETKVPLWTDTTDIKKNWLNFTNKIDAEAIKATNDLINVVNYFKNNNQTKEDFESYLAFLRWDQRGLVRKVSKSGLGVLELKGNQETRLEHNPPVQNIVEKTIDLFDGKITENEFRSFIDNAKVNLVTKALENILPNYVEGKNRMYDQKAVLYLQDLIDKGYKVTGLEKEYGSKAKFNSLVKLAKSGVTSTASIQNTNNIIAINSSSTTKYSKSPKGISVFDFDDTIGLTKSNVLYTMPGDFVVFHGAPKGKDVTKISDKGVKFFATDKREADEYARMHSGVTQEFVLNESQIVDEEVAINKIKELGLTPKNKDYSVDDALFYELIDPRFEESLSKPDITKLFDALKKDNIKALRYDDGAQVTGKTTISIAVIDPSIISEPKKLTGEQFAKEGATLLEEGAIFDFSEFSKVVDGKPGPMVEKMKKMISKFGPENFFILTARPANAAGPIHEFLSSIGINIPLENITGLGNSTAQAKADWMVAKAAEGYNDFYFSDDAIQNIKAVQDALNVLDVKSKIQQAKVKFSKTMSSEFNKIIEENKGVEEYKIFSDIGARRRGAKKNRFDLYVPPSAADFELLLYKFIGKGTRGEEQKEFFTKALLDPYTDGLTLMESARQSIKNEYKKLLKAFPNVKKDLEKLIPDGEFTYDQAIRVAMWVEGEKEIPGISERDKNKLTNIVESDPELKAFKDGLNIMGRQGIGWVKPLEYWDANTIISDLYNITEGDGRKKFLGEFIENVNEIFGEFKNGKLEGPNINKVEAVYGTNVREALEDVIYRMISGKNRSQGKDKQTSMWTNWVTGSTGAIMFLNIRSAALQLIGAVNFLNLRDNNPIAAAAAFANQPQYWKDFAYIWNSNKMKERRGGLKEDVVASEIANAAANSKNKVGAVLSYLLKIGYTPTQLADSFAIASGGAPFYRNRIKSYQSEYEGLDEDGKLKRKYTDAEAEKLAWKDFSKVSDETQQSGDPRDISKQQASAAGRLLLTFQNTAMQQSRIVKKAILDLKNRRGDDKTNVAKIVYYLAIQNTMFAVLQQGLFTVAFGYDDEDKEKPEKEKKLNEKLVDVTDGVIDTILRGTGFVGGAVATLKNMVKKYLEEKDKEFKADYTKVMLEGANISPPIGSKLRKLYSGLQQTKYDKDLIERRGWGVMQDGRVHLGPMYGISGKLVESLTNVPMDRLATKIENASQAMNSQNEAWQRVMVGLGWSPYSIGIEESAGDKAIIQEAKERRKEEARVKGIETRLRKKDSIRNLPPEKRLKIKKEDKIRRRNKRKERIEREKRLRRLGASIK